MFGIFEEVAKPVTRRIKNGADRLLVKTEESVGLHDDKKTPGEWDDGPASDLEAAARSILPELVDVAIENADEALSNLTGRPARNYVLSLFDPSAREVAVGALSLAPPGFVGFVRYRDAATEELQTFPFAGRATIRAKDGGGSEGVLEGEGAGLQVEGSWSAQTWEVSGRVKLSSGLELVAVAQEIGQGDEGNQERDLRKIEGLIDGSKLPPMPDESEFQGLGGWILRNPVKTAVIGIGTATAALVALLT